jgi:hypothetical protein
MYLDLAPSVRGQGFASEFNGYLERWYRASGVERIQVHANIDVGGYSWSAAGFDFADQYSASVIMARLEREIDKAEKWLREHEKDSSLRPGVYQAAQAEYEAARHLLDRARRTGFGHEDFPTAWEFSQVGRVPGQGKDAQWIASCSRARIQATSRCTTRPRTLRTRAAAPGLSWWWPRPTADTNRRAQAVLDNGSHLGLAGVFLGPWRPAAPLVCGTTAP